MTCLIIGAFIFLQDQVVQAASNGPNIPTTPYDPSRGFGVGGKEGILKNFDQTNGANSGITGLQTMLGNFGTTFTIVANALAVIMTACAAIMVGFGVQDGRQVLWSWILACGLAINFAPMLWAAFSNVGGLDPILATESSIQSFSVVVSNGSDTSFTILRDFFEYYHKTIYHAASHIVPYAIRICLVLTSIDAIMQLGLKLVEGDKVKFLVSKLLNCGIYIFLIMNWVGYGANGGSGWHLMPNLVNGFKGLGYAASAGDADKFIADGVVSNAVMVITKYYSAASAASIPLNAILYIIGVAVVIIMLLIALEMIMASLEFDTMALLTIPLLAFGTIPQLKFLAEKSIQTMFNCAIKCMCIAFLATVVNDVLSSYIEKFTGSSGVSNSWFEQFGNVLTFVVLVFMLFLLIHKLPQLVQGLLSGNPALSSGDMMGSLKTAASTAATAVNKPAAAAGQVVGAYRAAKNEAGGGFGGGLTGLKNAALGTAGNLWHAGKGGIPGVSGYRTGQQTLSNALQQLDSNKAGYGAKDKMDQGQFGAMLLRNMPYGGGGGGSGNGKGRTPEEAAKGFSQEYGTAKENNFKTEQKDSSLTDKAKSAAASAAGSYAGGQAGAAAGTAVGGPVGGVVGGLAGSAAGDAAGSTAYNHTSQGNENSSSSGTSGGGSGSYARTPEEGAQNFTNQYNAAQANGFQPHGGGGKGANGKGGKKNGGKK